MEKIIYNEILVKCKNETICQMYINLKEAIFKSSKIVEEIINKIILHIESIKVILN